MTDKEFQTAVAEAKKNGDTAKIKDLLTEFLRPEAKIAVEAAKENLTTKDGYSAIMQAAIACGPYKYFFIDACVREGYPADTAQTVKELV